MMFARATTYNNITYRSQIEARWAVFFDSLGLAHEYEPGTYDLSCGGYIPDFYLHDLKVFVEIKNYGHERPKHEECVKAMQLAELTKTPVFIFFGPMSLATHESRGSAWAYLPRDDSKHAVGMQYAFSRCPKCFAVDITHKARISCGCPLLNPRVSTLKDPVLQEARRRAASHTF